MGKGKMANSVELRPIEEVKPAGVYSVEQAAQVLGVGRRTVTKLAKTGELKSVLIDRKQIKILGNNLIEFLSNSERKEEQNGQD